MYKPENRAYTLEEPILSFKNVGLISRAYKNIGPILEAINRPYFGSNKLFPLRAVNIIMFLKDIILLMNECH